MPREKKGVDETEFTEDPKEVSVPRAFVEKKRRRKMSVHLDEDGIVDVSALSDEEKTNLIAGMLRDADTQAAFSQMSTTAPGITPGMLSPDDVRRLLQWFEVVEVAVMPKIIKMRTTVKMHGQVVKEGVLISPQVAVKAFTFPPETMEKMAPLGAMAANVHLPEKIRLWLTSIGPGSEFIGLFLLSINAQVKSAILMQSVLDQAAKGQVTSHEPAPQASGNGGPHVIWPPPEVDNAAIKEGTD